MSHTPRKRAAIEPAAALFESDPVDGPDTKRPAALIMGTVLVIARALGSVVWSLALFHERFEVQKDAKFTDDELIIVITVSITIAALWMLLLLLLAWRIWAGSNRARMLVMFGTTISIVSAAVSYFASGEQITVHTTLLTLALDILILLTLSSRESRAWSRGRNRRRS